MHHSENEPASDTTCDGTDGWPQAADALFTDRQTRVRRDFITRVLAVRGEIAAGDALSYETAVSHQFVRYGATLLADQTGKDNTQMPEYEAARLLLQHISRGMDKTTVRETDRNLTSLGYEHVLGFLAVRVGVDKSDDSEFVPTIDPLNAHQEQGVPSLQANEELQIALNDLGADETAAKALTAWYGLDGSLKPQAYNSVARTLGISFGSAGSLVKGWVGRLPADLADKLLSLRTHLTYHNRYNRNISNVPMLAMSIFTGNKTARHQTYQPRSLAELETAEGVLATVEEQMLVRLFSAGRLARQELESDNTPAGKLDRAQRSTITLGERAGNILVARNQDLLRTIVAKFARYSDSDRFDEMMSVGNTALIIALCRYEDMGTTIATYVLPRVFRAVERYSLVHRHGVVLGIQNARCLQIVRQAQHALEERSSDGGLPKVEEVRAEILRRHANLKNSYWLNDRPYPGCPTLTDLMSPDYVRSTVSLDANLADDDGSFTSLDTMPVEMATEMCDRQSRPVKAVKVAPNLLTAREMAILSRVAVSHQPPEVVFQELRQIIGGGSTVGMIRNAYAKALQKVSQAHGEV